MSTHDPQDAPSAVEGLPKAGDTLTLRAQSIDERGAGVSTLRLLLPGASEPRTLNVHVPGLLPGETATAEVTRRRRGRVDAVATALLTPHPERRTPPCPHFHPLRQAGETCGGCALQQVNEAVQLSLKVARTRQQLAAQGLDASLLTSPLPAPTPWGYRNKMEFSFAEDAEGALALGLHPPGYRHDVLSLTECRIFNDWCGPFLRWFREHARSMGLRAYHARSERGWLRTLMLRESARSGEILMELGTAHEEVTDTPATEEEGRRIASDLLEASHRWLQEQGRSLHSGWWTRTLAKRGQPTRLMEENLLGSPCIHETLHVAEDVRLSFEIHPRAFFQPNTLQAERLYARVLALSGLLEGAERSGTVLDLYCGTGTIGLALANWARRVVGIEMQPSAVENAIRNAREHGFENAHFFAGDVADLLGSEALRPLLEDLRAVVVDPPRAGLSPDALRLVADLRPPRLVYVSCNPETLARDLAELARRGWRCERIEPVDMFPHTAHIENVALLHAPSESGLGGNPRQGPEEDELEGPG